MGVLKQLESRRRRPSISDKIKSPNQCNQMPLLCLQRQFDRKIKNTHLPSTTPQQARPSDRFLEFWGYVFWKPNENNQFLFEPSQVKRYARLLSRYITHLNRSTVEGMMVFSRSRSQEESLLFSFNCFCSACFWILNRGNAVATTRREPIRIN